MGINPADLRSSEISLDDKDKFEICIKGDTVSLEPSLRYLADKISTPVDLLEFQLLRISLVLLSH